jgi:hypothetical protein
MSLYHDVIEALTPLVEAFERLGILYYIGGSVSSSLHGMARRTQDVDLIADLKPNQVRPSRGRSRANTTSMSRPGRKLSDVVCPIM